jgi:hypothetical protein
MPIPFRSNDAATRFKNIGAQASTVQFMYSNLIFFSKKKNRRTLTSRPAAAANVSEKGVKSSGGVAPREGDQRASAAQRTKYASQRNRHCSISKSSGACACPAAAASNGRIPQPPSPRSPAPVTRDPRPDPTARGALNSKPLLGAAADLYQPTTGINCPQRLARSLARPVRGSYKRRRRRRWC